MIGRIRARQDVRIEPGQRTVGRASLFQVITN
jgi:hypothetical protein